MTADNQNRYVLFEHDSTLYPTTLQSLFLRKAAITDIERISFDEDGLLVEFIDDSGHETLTFDPLSCKINLLANGLPSPFNASLSIESADGCLQARVADDLPSADLLVVANTILAYLSENFPDRPVQYKNIPYAEMPEPANSMG